MTEIHARQRCPGCGQDLPRMDGPMHRYMTASPACWAGFGVLLAADYAEPDRRPFHQIVVDAYAAQHPGEGLREQVQSVGIHLMTLCMFLEHGTDPALGSDLHRRMIGRPAFHRIEPAGVSALTVLHVPTGGRAEYARKAAYEWGQAVWDLYEREHSTVRRWLMDAGFDLRRKSP